ncbi:ATP-binding protein [Hydrogenimonas sp. SS33]|uniref:ATP-binding protein n=1 Tax=Hydrogenimonas leucolamina TaxID=2954236 RepID=UPI00336BEDA7
MSELRRAAALFEDRVDRDDYFDAASAEVTKKRLLGLIAEPERKLLFLLGEPGVGKTKMLHTLEKVLREEGKRRVVHLKEPFFDPERFLATLLEAAGEKAEGPLESLKARAVSHYGEREHLIMIDEAQLMSDPSLEFLRILADTKAFSFLLSMHRKEGEEILARPHFRSRSHRVVEMGMLRRDEVSEYLKGRLADEKLAKTAGMLDRRVTDRIHRYSGGNFRFVKRMAQTLFELMDEAREEGIARYRRPNRCLVDMAALDVGLING